MVKFGDNAYLVPRKHVKTRNFGHKRARGNWFVYVGFRRFGSLFSLI